MLILAMIKGGTSTPWVLWIFVAAVALWSSMAIRFGLLGRAGPKLSPSLRRAYPWMHRTIHLLLAMTAVAVLFHLLERPLPYLDAWVMLLVTLAAGTFHGLFHFWRHTALFDRALHVIMPRFMHKWL